MWKWGFLLFLLFHSFTAKAVSDSLLYPKAQLDAFKGRVGDAKRYSDNQAVPFRCLPQAPALYWNFNKADYALAIRTIESSTSPEHPLKIPLFRTASDSLLLIVRKLTPAEELVKSTLKRPADYFTYSENGKENVLSSGLKIFRYPSKIQNWVYEKTSAKESPSDEIPSDGFFVFLASERVQSQTIPLSYSRSIYYFQKLTGFGLPACPQDAKKDFVYPVVTAAKALSGYLEDLIPRPFDPDSIVSSEVEGNYLDSFVLTYNNWEKDRWKVYDSAHAADPMFKRLIEAATTEALREKNGPPNLAALLLHFGDTKLALQISCYRLNQTFSCIMSYQIRLSVMETARCAAATLELTQFVNAHLRISATYKDSWYKQFNVRDTRYAYTRELEYIGIDVPHFLLGMALRTADPRIAGNSLGVSKVVSLLYESSQPQVIEEVFVAAALDKRLDLHNRVACYQVLADYYKLRYRKDDIAIDKNKLDRIKATMPSWAIKNRDKVW